MGKLVVMENGSITREYLVDGTFTIGRALHCNLSLDLPEVCPHHAQIIAQPDEASGENIYHVRDLYSQQGTYLNDRPVSNDVLKDQDVLSIGGYELTFVAGQTEAEATSL